MRSRSNLATYLALSAWMFASLLVAASAAKADVLPPEPLRRGVVLLLVEDRGCPWCARWDEEVREAYLNSPEGKFARLERRLRGSRDVAFLARVAYSPTFVLLKDGREVGRILGYPGADFFWSMVSELLARAGFGART